MATAPVWVTGVVVGGAVTAVGYGVYSTARDWDQMSGADKSELAGEFIGGIATGGLGARAGSALVSAARAGVVRTVVAAPPVRSVPKTRTPKTKPNTRPRHKKRQKRVTAQNKTTPRGPKNGVPSGRRTRINPKDTDPANIRSLTKENDAASLLAKKGYQVEQNPTVPGVKNPDYLIEGRVFDAYSPRPGTKLDNIIAEMSSKAGKGQADRVVLNLDGHTVPTRELKAALVRASKTPGNGMQTMREILLVQDGRVSRLWPTD